VVAYCQLRNLFQLFYLLDKIGLLVVELLVLVAVGVKAGEELDELLLVRRPTN
jgi:hypothetical protein